MEASFPSTILINKSSNTSRKIAVSANPNFSPNLISFFRCRNKLLTNGSRRSPVKVPAAIGEAAASVSDPAQAQVTWQVVVGALAGVTPFVVAGIEFRKRIVAQRTCGVCRGSGLIQREKYYFRCPRCGGFLPWQSWKKFFSG